MTTNPEIQLAAGLASLGMDPKEAADYAASKSKAPIAYDRVKAHRDRAAMIRANVSVGVNRIGMR